MIAGLGPHGELAASPEQLILSDEEVIHARSRRFRVGVALHTKESDWSRQQVAGIISTLSEHNAVVTDVVDCQFDSERQCDALERMCREKLDVIMSLPVGNAAVVDAHRAASAAGIRLLLIDNVPTGLLPGVDYVSVVSADNFGLGLIGAQLLSPYLQTGSTAGILGYGVDFFATNQREIAFRRWMASERPDVTLKHTKFTHTDQAAAQLDAFLDTHDSVSGLFSIWDEPAIAALAVLRGRNHPLPVTAVDLGNEVSVDLARGGLIKGVGAQQPFSQGQAIARAALLSLLDRAPPSWIGLPGLEVSRKNVVEAYQKVWHTAAPAGLIDGLVQESSAL